MTLLGTLALWLALLVGVWGALAGFVGGLNGRADLAHSARHAVFAMCGALLVAVVSLEWALFQHDFNVEYVAAYTSRNLPIFYTWSALYAGQKGSLLFWATVLSVFALGKWPLLLCLLLSIGICLGRWRAYVELGWGGSWAWDPVENASLLPWLTMAAFLHLVMIQEKRGMLKKWNLALIIGSWLLSIFGTFITRSGVISSVHSFTQSNVAYFFLFFLLVAGTASFTVYADRLQLRTAEAQPR